MFSSLLLSFSGIHKWIRPGDKIHQPQVPSCIFIYQYKFFESLKQRREIKSEPRKMSRLIKKKAMKMTRCRYPDKHPVLLPSQLLMVAGSAARSSSFLWIGARLLARLIHIFEVALWSTDCFNLFLFEIKIA